MPKQLHLALDVSWTQVETAWRLPGSWVGRHYPDVGLFEDIARIAERGLFDMIFFGDGSGVPNTWEGGIDAAVRRALSKEAVAGELASIGFARTGFERDDGRMDLSGLTGSHAAVLQAKRQSLMDLAKLCGWVVEKREDVSVEERISRMTDEQRLEEARKLADRIRRRLALEAPELIEGVATQVEE
ncbi:MAG TPA: hypothetical protein VGR70_04815 [Stellaceae bacterium]|nr:hypothetical protein [Stellaceae bacterium]